MKKLSERIKIDDGRGIITIDGHPVTIELLEIFTLPTPAGKWFRFEEGPSGYPTRVVMRELGDKPQRPGAVPVLISSGPAKPGCRLGRLLGGRGDQQVVAIPLKDGAFPPTIEIRDPGGPRGAATFEAVFYHYEGIQHRDDGEDIAVYTYGGFR
jgi:hypothetical protein